MVQCFSSCFPLFLPPDTVPLYLASVRLFFTYFPHASLSMALVLTAPDVAERLYVIVVPTTRVPGSLLSSDGLQQMPSDATL